MANQEIHKAIEIIDRQIKLLTQAKQILTDTFGGITNEPTLPLSFVTLKEDIKQEVVKRTRTAPTRRDMIVNLLRQRGPLPRKEIIENVDMPTGSISFVLSDKTTFFLKDDKWHLVENTEN